MGICINAKALLALRTSLFTVVLVEPPPPPSTHPKKSVSFGMWALALHRLREWLVSVVFLEVGHSQPHPSPALGSSRRAGLREQLDGEVGGNE